jgi:hypothetical protein
MILATGPRQKSRADGFLTRPWFECRTDGEPNPRRRYIDGETGEESVRERLTGVASPRLGRGLREGSTGRELRREQTFTPGQAWCTTSPTESAATQ